MADFWKYQALGNDYLVLEPAGFTTPLTPEAARLICDRHRGIGADGILLGPLPPREGEGFAVRIINPDGSEAEKSGNGLRIFARHLWERGLAPARGMTLVTPSGAGRAEVLGEDAGRVAVDMGTISFSSGAVPMSGPEREVVDEPLEVGGRKVAICAVNVGNPHCVVHVGEATAALARDLGPLIEAHPAFPHRTNVQFMASTGPHAIRIEIWERGAGYTLSSGSSSCAAAAAAVRLGLCASPVTVSCPGGSLRVELDHDLRARLEGEVAAVGHGEFSAELLAAVGLRRAPGGGAA